MAKFCKKCGSKLDEVSGKCPNCDKVAEEKNTSSDNVPEQQKQLSKKEMKAEKKKLKKQAKKDKKKQKRAQLTTKQKVKRFFVKFIAVILALIIAVSGCACVLVYFDFVDIPFVSDVMSKIGITPKDDDTNDFNSITGKFTDILVTDEQSAIAAAQEAASQMGLGNAAEELTVNNVSTVGDLKYYRLQQNYQGIPVYGKTIVLIVDSKNQVISVTSNLVDIKDASKNTNISQDNIKSNVKKYLLDANLINDETKLNLFGFDNIVMYFNEESVFQAYRLNVFLGDSPISFYEVVVNAESGEVLTLTQTVNEEAVDCFNSDQTVVVSGYYDEDLNQFQLYDSNRGILIYTYNNTNSDSSTAEQIFITSDNEIFGDTSEETALEQNKGITLLKNISEIYDFYNATFNENGYGTNYCYYNDAYDAGKNALGGNATSLSGETVGYLSMGSVTGVECLDTVAHEYTHVVSRKLVDWVNISAWTETTDEPGAINEGYSDIFGEIIEASINNEMPNWEHGDRIIHNPMSQGYPASVGDKKYKKFSSTDGTKWGMHTTGNSYTDYSHGFSTIISHCAYLMNSGVNGTNGVLNLKDLSSLWYHTLHTIPSDCSFVLLRECMELTADNLGFTQEQKQCISAAFDEVGIESQDSEEKYSDESTLSVKDRNGDSYDDYTIKITGKKYRGFMKTGLWKEDYNDEISVSNSDPVSLNLTRGDYTITVTDNFDSSNSVSKSVKIRGGSKNKELVMATSFGFDYVINPSSQLTVFDMNNQLYDNYSVKIDGTYTDANNVKQSYSDNLTSNTSEPITISLNEGKYSFLLKDGLDNTKTKSFTVRVRSVGSADFKVYTAFGKKAGQYDKSNIPKDAVEYNGHYYYIYTDERSWYDADDFCKSQNGYLATITSSEEQQFVQQYMQKVKKSLTTNNNETWNKELWIGANDLNFEGVWEWSNGESFNYTNWGNNQPDDSGGQDYGALLSFLSEGNGYRINEGQWDDTDAYRCPFICEWGEYTPESAEKEISSQPKRETSDKRDIVLVLDVSGSMSGTPLEETKKAATKFISTILKEDASIGIVVYDDNAEVLSDFSMDEEKLTGIVSGITDRGSTNIDDGLTKANELLQYSNAEKKIIVLMSDGMPNCGREGDDLIAFADSIKDTGTYIYTLGFFESVGGSKSSAQLLMEGIASDGCHYEVADADDLVFFFGDIADQINGQKFIYVRIACPVDVTVTYLGESLSSSEKDFNDRTSFGSLSLEDIEDSDDKIKTLRLKEGKDYAIKINGTGRGKMDYTIGYMDDSGEYSDMRNFRNINITRSTVIDTSTKYSDKTILNVDEDGDGKYDLKFRAGANEYGELVDYTYIIYIALGVVGAITVLIAVVVIRKKMKKRKAA